jgi:uncharacterized membrane protein
MPNHTWGIVIGGIIPALLYGLSTITMKAGAESKISTSSYLMAIGVVIFLTGFALKPLLNTSATKESWLGLGFSIISGLFWAVATSLVNYSIVKFGTPIAILTPLYNMNTLFAVLGGLILFAEWKSVNSLPVFIGTIFIVVGGILVSRA